MKWRDRYIYAKKFLPYVHSTSKNAMLIHKVASVRMSWERGNGKLTMIAETVCGMSKILAHHYAKPGEVRAKMCEIPDPNAVLCGRCHGELPTFSRRRKIRIEKRWAKDHLSCKGIVEVIGPYVRPA